jgi:hypothetical protein
MTHASQNSMLIGKHGQGLDFPLRAVKLIAVLFVVLIIPALSCATVCAQGVIIPKVEPRLTLYNALYYSIDGALLHVEIVRSVENRKLVALRRERHTVQMGTDHHPDVDERLGGVRVLLRHRLSCPTARVNSRKTSGNRGRVWEIPRPRGSGKEHNDR